jgi:hypothetical protein
MGDERPLKNGWQKSLPQHERKTGVLLMEQDTRFRTARSGAQRNGPARNVSSWNGESRD